MKITTTTLNNEEIENTDEEQECGKMATADRPVVSYNGGGDGVCDKCLLLDVGVMPSQQLGERVRDVRCHTPTVCPRKWKVYLQTTSI